MAASELKTERIDIRTTAAAKELLQRAAASAHKNVSEFLVDAGLAAAAETLADRRLFPLEEDRWREFQNVLDRPVRRKARLKKLLSKPSVLE